MPRHSRPRSRSAVRSAPLTARFGSPAKRMTGGLSGDHGERPAARSPSSPDVSAERRRPSACRRTAGRRPGRLPASAPALRPSAAGVSPSAMSRAAPVASVKTSVSSPEPPVTRNATSLPSGTVKTLRLGVGLGRQEDRRLAGIGRRRHPGVDARRQRVERALRAEAVADAAAERPEGEGEGDDQKQRRGGAQSPRIALGHAGARQVAADACRACSPCASDARATAPAAKRVVLAGRPVGLHQHAACAPARWRARCGGRSRRAAAGGRSAADRARQARRARSAASRPSRASRAPRGTRRTRTG